MPKPEQLVFLALGGAVIYDVLTGGELRAMLGLDFGGGESVPTSLPPGSQVPTGAASTAPGYTPPGSTPVTATTERKELPPPPEGQPGVSPPVIAPEASNTVIEQMKSLAGNHRQNFWQWNYYHEQITGRVGPDPFRLGIFTTKEEVEGSPMPAEEWANLVNSLGYSPGMAGLGTYRQNPNIGPTAYEQMVKIPIN